MVSPGTSAPSPTDAARSPLDLTLASARALAEWVRRREVSAREVVEAHLARIEAVNPALNAVVVRRYAEARRRADEVDRAVARGEDVGPLAGVPCTIKESIGVAGCPNTGGSRRRLGARATRNATVVERLLAAGAIPVGLTNLSELGLWIESTNAVYGRTNNPYDVQRTAGGSSGGDASIVGAGGVPFGIGSDMGGSIRFPAYCCGVFGHKPTTGLVPLSGQFPDDFTAFRRDELVAAASYVATGPIARRAEDLPLVLDVIAGPDGRCVHTDRPGAGARDEGARAREEYRAAADGVGMKGRRVYVLERPEFLAARRPSPLVARTVARAAKILEGQGAIVEPWHSPRLARAMDIYTSALAATGGHSFADYVGVSGGLGAARELLRAAFGQAEHSWQVLLLCAAESVVRPSPARVERFLAERAALLAELELLLGHHAILLLPPFARSAPRHHTTMLAPFDLAYTALFNALRSPATSAPLGLGPDGLPLGVQIVAGLGHDALTLGTARLLERVGGGWVRPEPALLAPG